jgi:hypothetical protein
VLAWYLRRAVPWAALLGCCAAAGLLALTLERWPSTALLVLPAVLGCCAGAAAFAFDERALPVVEVTPRGDSWRRTARLAVAGVPVAVWAALVLAGPGDLPSSRPSWLLLGVAAIALTAGAAGVLSHGTAAPGGSLAGVVVLVVLGPVVLDGFLGWGSIYPFEPLGAGLTVLWSGVALVAVAACVGAVRPRLRRHAGGVFG